MNRSVMELGRLVRSYRKERGQTQHELAERIQVSRSAIALMEQGRRLLPADALQTISRFFGIPDSVVGPFMSPAFQSRRNKVAPQPVSFVPFSLLCVSGISGSGKTTLARVIARTFGAERIGSHPTGRAYLLDLAKDEGRWAFEAQVAFLVTKARMIQEKSLGGHPLVVERWIDEDALVYERLFRESGAIGPRSHETFGEVSKLASVILPTPEFHFYCECSPETALRRIHERGRGDSRLHTKDFITRSEQLYKEWLSNLEGPEIYILNTDDSDLSRRGVMEEVFREIEWVLTHDLSNPQMSLFESELNGGNGHLSHLRPAHQERWSTVNKIWRRAITGASPLVAPVAYLAAPFTGQDVEKGEDGSHPDFQDYLFREILQDLRAAAHGHGVIPRHGFRNGLLGIERALTEFGLSVLIPHRDVNEWGKKQLSPDDAMRQCTNHVSNCDLFVGILGGSCGAHYEFGLASAFGKPCILINVEEISGSFLARGASALTQSQDIINLSCRRLKDAEDLLKNSPEVRDFLRRNFGGGIGLID